ncbi:MAG: hypothetical protein Fur002_14860 [Anaerolineales bacterium]
MGYDLNDDMLTGMEEDLPEESNNNRTFMIAVGILGGLILISVACLGGVYLFSSKGATAAQQAQAAAATQTKFAADNYIAQSLTSTAEAAILPTVTLPPTATATQPVSQPSATPTVDLALTSEIGPSGLSMTQAVATSTVAAALTQAALAQETVVALPSPTALAGTGFADEYGAPGLVALALAFILVILFSRRLRSAPTA